MAWTETYHCDVCNKEMHEETADWWLVWLERISPTHDQPDQPLMKLTPWNAFLSHASGMRHICGARCAQTLMNRWMMGEAE